MTRTVLLSILVGATGCDGVSVKRFNTMVNLHEDRMQIMETMLEKKTSNMNTRIDALEASLTEAQGDCGDITIAPSGFSRLGRSGLMIAVDSYQRDDGSFSAIVANTMGITIETSIRVGDATVTVPLIDGGRARRVKLFAPAGSKHVTACAQDVRFSYSIQR